MPLLRRSPLTLSHSCLLRGNILPEQQQQNKTLQTGWKINTVTDESLTLKINPNESRRFNEQRLCRGGFILLEMMNTLSSEAH